MGTKLMRPSSLVFFMLLAIALVAGGCATRDLPLERQQAYQLYQAGEYGQAVEQFQELVKAIPKDAELWFRLGNSYAKAQQPKNAIMAYENALLRDPSMTKAWYNMGIIHMQAALKAFADMRTYVRNEEDPIGLQGERMREGLFLLLEGSSEADAQEN